MRVFMVAVAGLMVAAVGQAQSWPPLNAGAVPIGARCPGQLIAQHQPTGGATVWTVAQEDKNREGQAKGLGLHVEFEAPNVKTPMNKVQAMELSVSYLPAGSRVMPIEAGTDSKNAKESKKTFVLQQEAARRFDANLLVGPAATITRVHLVSATFADGNVWHASSEDVCSVEPSKYMLVEAKR